MRKSSQIRKLKLQRSSDLETVLINNFVSFIRKASFKTFQNISESFATVCNMIFPSSFARRIEILCDSYLEVSIKRSEGLCRFEVQPMDVVNLALESTMLLELESI